MTPGVGVARETDLPVQVRLAGATGDEVLMGKRKKQTAPKNTSLDSHAGARRPASEKI